MARKREDTGRSCPHCGSTLVCRNGKNRGQQRFLCTACEKTFGERSGTPMFGLHTPAEEVARTLLILMRRAMPRRRSASATIWAETAHPFGKGLSYEAVESKSTISSCSASAVWIEAGDVQQDRVHGPRRYTLSYARGTASMNGTSDATPSDTSCNSLKMG
jgi:hypothetical protein